MDLYQIYKLTILLHQTIKIKTIESPTYKSMVLR